MTTDVAAICASLTKAQRATLIWMGDDATWCRPDQRSIPALSRSKLVEGMISRSILFNRLTPLGLAVRAALQQNDEGDFTPPTPNKDEAR